MNHSHLITPDEYILKTHLGFSWKDRFRGMPEYQRYQSYIDNINEVKEFKGIRHEEYVKEAGLEKIMQSIDVCQKIALSHSHMFIVDWKSRYLNLELQQLVKKKPKYLKNIDYSKFLGSEYGGVL